MILQKHGHNNYVSSDPADLTQHDIRIPRAPTLTGLSQYSRVVRDDAGRITSEHSLSTGDLQSLDRPTSTGMR